MTDATQPNLGAVVREVRRENGWTLTDVSGRTGIPVSTLSKIENGKLSLSYDKLVQLSRGLGVDITRLFGGPSPAGPPPNAAFVRRSVNHGGDGKAVETATYDHRYLAQDLLNKRLDPILAELKATSISQFEDWIRHEGEEFTYVLEGTVEFYSEFYAPVVLQAGDSVYFDSGMGHAYVRVGDPPARVLSICTGGQEEVLRPLVQGQARPGSPGKVEVHRAASAVGKEFDKT